MATKRRVKRRFVLAGLLVAAAALGEVTETTEVAKARGTYEAAVRNLTLDHEAMMAECVEAYEVLLEDTVARFQKEGDLESVLAVMAEQKRFKQESAVPAEPPEGKPPVIAALHAAFHHAARDAEAQHRQALSRTVDAYVRRLEPLKNELTKKGDIQGAMAVKDAQERARQSLPAIPAEKESASQQMQKPAVPPPHVVETVRTTCARCSGSGQAPGKCAACRGSGQCAACEGKGKRPSLMKGSRSMPMCLACKGSGRCATCQGNGEGPMGVCAACSGSGIRIETKAVASAAPPAAEVPGPEGEAVVSLPPKRGTANPRPRHDRTGLSQYVETMTALTDRYRSEAPEPVDFRDVLARQREYTGRILQSDVYLVSGFSRGVRVAADRRDVNREGELLIPHTLPVGIAADKLFKAEGKGVPVSIVYGVVNTENRTLFSIEPAARKE